MCIADLLICVFCCVLTRRAAGTSDALAPLGAFYAQLHCADPWEPRHIRLVVGGSIVGGSSLQWYDCGMAHGTGYGDDAGWCQGILHMCTGHMLVGGTGAAQVAWMYGGVASSPQDQTVSSHGIHLSLAALRAVRCK
jgi:hypothetical protein